MHQYDVVPPGMVGSLMLKLSRHMLPSRLVTTESVEERDWKPCKQVQCNIMSQWFTFHICQRAWLDHAAGSNLILEPSEGPAYYGYPARSLSLPKEHHFLTPMSYVHPL